MAFKKGQSGNPKGREKGSLNKSTRENNERIDKVLKILSKTLEADLKALPEGERIKTWLALCEYRNHKLSRSEIAVEIDDPFELSLSDDQLQKLIKAIVQPTNGKPA